MEEVKSMEAAKTEECPMCDGSGRVWVALDSDGEVAREQCILCDQKGK